MFTGPTYRPGPVKDSPHTEDTIVYLLMSQAVHQARGFGDRHGIYTFAFTTPAKANEFIRQARQVGFLQDVDMLCEITIGEFFRWKDKGMTNSNLNIDPDPDMLQHPVFFETRHRDN